MQNKILIIGPFPSPISGVSIANEVMAKGLQRKNWNVDTINSEYSQKITNKHGKISFRKLAFIKTYLLIYKLFFSKIIYITVGQSFYGVIKYSPFILLAKLSNKVLVVHLHGNHLLKEYDTLKGIKKKVFGTLISMFDYGIVLSESLRPNFEPFFKKEHIFELHNFFEKTLSEPKELLLRRKDYSELRLVFLSNLMEEKGINILLEAVKRLKDRGIHFQVKVAGHKIKENDVSNLLNGLDNVEYLGVVQGKQKKELLLWATVFCLPTFYKMEGQPISILEAMATGNLILTTRHAGITDVCKEENAVFCEKENVEDLENKLELLFKDNNQIQQKGLLNIDYANEFFNEEKFIENANKILLQCIN
ncbi:MAG TPA: glycosyltransferase family 4 protein [Flavobacterium sp.]